ncbi:acyltransferase family protein [Siphonobacter aquaeclarae]|uniref:Peptidoglycan/LPS O-acetylase OafA/YrhL, contains acyltransferase and SGNH-hydrolase domains n=1 Tax=Siphonobacter aquaeclarae TaxID=563176 RepID=A0A1G9IFI8_9BACT|nr:acyltransferase [Siphonobacter aquaeclarae]SDL23979.1 Peptidoglycan/LPS O-acetylase OafA/YrhL, contains acyltransferase and SGNH-hydrolase domains [Siphonobacter aquaeclarae]
MNLSDERHNNLDFIRFLAALSVVVSHSYDLSGRVLEEPLRILANYSFSFFGVRTFFVISGYLICSSLVSNPDAVRFFKRRVRRIFPGLVVVVVLCAFVLGPLVTILPAREYFLLPETYNYLINILLYRSQFSLPGVFSTNDTDIVNGSLWTLVYEFSCYIGLFLMHRAGVLRMRSLVLAFFLLGIVADALISGTTYANNFYPSVNMVAGSAIEFTTFFTGGIVLYLYREEARRRRKVLALASLAGLVLLAMLPAPWSRALAFLTLPPGIYYLAFQPGKLNTFGARGDFSYGIYIYSFPVQQTLLYYFPGIHVGLLIILSVVCTMPLAWFSWNFVEKPMIRRRTTAVVASPLT